MCGELINALCLVWLIDFEHGCVAVGPAAVGCGMTVDRGIYAHIAAIRTNRNYS